MRTHDHSDRRDRGDLSNRRDRRLPDPPPQTGDRRFPSHCGNRREGGRRGSAIAAIEAIAAIAAIAVVVGSDFVQTPPPLVFINLIFSKEIERER